MYNHFAANTLKNIFFSNTFLRNNYLKIQFNYVCKHLSQVVNYPTLLMKINDF